MPAPEERIRNAMQSEDTSRKNAMLEITTDGEKDT